MHLFGNRKNPKKRIGPGSNPVTSTRKKHLLWQVLFSVMRSLRNMMRTACVMPALPVMHACGACGKRIASPITAQLARERISFLSLDAAASNFTMTAGHSFTSKGSFPVLLLTFPSILRPLVALSHNCWQFRKSFICKGFRLFLLYLP